MLPASTARKLKARTAAGLANPIHAYGASGIATYEARQMRDFATRDATERNSIIVTNPIADGRELTPWQEQALRDELPYDDAGKREAPSTWPAKVLRQFEIKQLHGGSGVQLTHILALLAAICAAGFFRCTSRDRCCRALPRTDGGRRGAVSGFHILDERRLGSPRNGNCRGPTPDRRDT